MSQHVEHVPLPQVPAAPAREEKPGARSSWLGRHRKLVLGGVTAIALVAGGIGLTVALRAGHPSDTAPVSDDVPRREGDAIVLSDAFREAAGLETTAVVSTLLTPLVNVVGAVEFDPTHLAAVGTRASGVVTKVLHVEGDFVNKGDVLAEIESGALADAHADLRIASAKRHAASLDAERERMLLERGLTTAREEERAQSALAQQKALETAARERVAALGGGRVRDTGISQLRAPVAGVVAERALAPGQSVTPGLVAFRVGDVDRLWVLLRVFERHVGLVKEGDAVEIHPMSDGETVVPGKVTHVGAVLDPATRTTDVRVAVEDGKRILRPGQAVNATIQASGPERVALAVPASAITYVDGKPTVFVAESETRFSPRAVELGLDSGAQVEITEGLRQNERVVSKNVLAVKSELFR